jgi:hypothetical protein
VTPQNRDSIYCPPRYNIYANEYKTLFDKMNIRFIIGGDFNAKHTHWGSRLLTAKGRELYKAVTDTRCEIAYTGKPTCWPTKFHIYLISLLKIFQQTSQIEK